jgi:hypothetical protein
LVKRCVGPNVWQSRARARLKHAARRGSVHLHTSDLPDKCILPVSRPLQGPLRQQNHEREKSKFISRFNVILVFRI